LKVFALLFELAGGLLGLPPLEGLRLDEVELLLQVLGLAIVVGGQHPDRRPQHGQR